MIGDKCPYYILLVSIVAWFLYCPSKKLVFVPVASLVPWRAVTDCSVLASVAQWPEIQPLVSQG